MRRTAAGLLLALGLMTPCAAQEAAAPQTPAPVAQILTLDKERVFRESAAGQAIEQQIALENEALAVENREIDAGLEAEERALTTRRPLLGVAEFQVLAEEFNTKAVSLREAQVSKAKALERKREDARQAFFQSLVPVLGEIMKQAGALVILDDKAVLLSFERIDVTDEAIKQMNALGTPPAP